MLGTQYAEKEKYEERNGAEPFSKQSYTVNTGIPTNCLTFPQPVSQNASFFETVLKCSFLFLCVLRFRWCSLWGQSRISKLTIIEPILSFDMCMLVEGPTCKPRHASVFSTHSDTQAVPAFHCIQMFKGIFFDTVAASVLKRTDTLFTNA